jgi:Gamma-glutamyl cyclotransferase, AIG2-like
MAANEKDSELLFSYGTLQQEAVQLATFGRKLNGSADALGGYRLSIIRIDDAEFVASSGSADQRNLDFTGDAEDVVEGTVFTVTQAELEQADAYEPARYARHLVQLRSGLNAWVYSVQVQPTENPS